MIAAARALHLACLLAVFGASLFRAISNDVGLARTRLRRPLAVAALAALATAALLDLHGGFGTLALVRLALLLVTSVCCVAGTVPKIVALAAGAALLLFPLGGHAAQAGPAAHAALRTANDAVHLLAAGVWFGGLVALVPEMVPRIADRTRLIALLRQFSRLGVVAVALLLVAGTIDALVILDRPGLDWTATYVALLAIKIVLAAVMLALALTNRFAVLPALVRGEAEAAQTIPLTVLAELAAAALILCIVGVLGTLSPTRV